MEDKRIDIDGTHYRCHRCEKIRRFIGPVDNGTRYGCADPESPEPYDPDFFCKPCARKEYQEAIIELQNSEGNTRHKPWWIMPDFYSKAMQECGWVSTEDHLIKKI